MDNTENILFLYLDTGSGHLGPARVLKQEIEKRLCEYAEIDKKDMHIFLYNGFAQSQHIAHFVFETNYHISTNYIDGSWFLTYEATRNPVFLHFLRTMLYLRTPDYIESLIKKHHITKVVSFHFALTPSIVRACRRFHPQVETLVIVTDPFTTHVAWFLEPQLQFIVFSDHLKNTIIREQGIDPNRIRVMPFIIDPKFCSYVKPSELSVSRKKTLLIAGGGEGLPHSFEIIQEAIRENADFKIIVVCGRNKALQKTLEILILKYPHIDVQIFGFVKNMHELMHNADCIIGKPGASTLFEIIACKKPAIFSTFLHGQELGNIRFAVENNIAWFIRNPRDIFAKVQHLFNDSAYYAQTVQKLENLHITFDPGELLEFFLGTAS